MHDAHNGNDLNSAARVVPAEILRKPLSVDQLKDVSINDFNIRHGCSSDRFSHLRGIRGGLDALAVAYTPGVFPLP